MQKALLLAVLSVRALFAQATAVVQISGTVTDPGGAAVPGAQLRATQTETGLVRSAVSATDGSYTLTSLPIGPYRIETSASGFRTQVQQGVVLQVNTNPILNVVLEVGTLQQSVEVSASAAMVESQSNSISQVIDQRRVVDLPLNGRQPTQLILLSGAAVTAPPSDMASSKNYPSSVTISVAGGQANGTYYLMDGGDHADSFGLINLPLPFPDALQEFSVQTNAIPAAYGVRAGAVVNVVTKSGTNEVHGNVFEFLRTGVTNARNFFAPRRDNLKRNQFGGTIGAPIVKNRLFVFGGYQGTRIRTAPPTSTVFVPTGDVLRGDFSTLESAACAGRARALTDPVTRQPFPGNIIPVSRFSQPALNFLKLVPTTADPCGRLLFGVPNNQDEDQFILRSDHIRSERHTIFGRYYFTDFRNPAAYDGQNLLLTTRPGVLDRVQSLVLGDTFSLSPNAVNNFHFAWTRGRVTRGPAPNLPTASSVGLRVADSPGNFPQISVNTRFSTFCGTCSLAHVNSGSLQFANDLSWIRGRHQLEFGFNYIRRNLDFQVTTQQNAAFSFDGSFTGDPMADLFLGNTSQFVQGNRTKLDFIHNYFGFYAQDKFRVNSRLSLNYGVRWEPYFPERDVFGRATHFDIDWYRAGRKSAVFQNAPAGILFAGDEEMPRAGTKRTLGNFAPRAGLIWDPKGDGRFTVRAAYSILFDTPPMQYFDRFGFGPPWASTISLFAPVGGFADPYQGYPGGNPFPLPTPPPKDAFFPLAGQFVNLPWQITPSYMQQWNLSLQRQVGTAWLLTANYLGNHSLHRWVNRAINPAVFMPGATTGNTNDRRRLTLLNRDQGRYYGPFAELDDGAHANYNGLLLSLNRRMHRNFSALANYTWSHCISESDASSEIGGGYQNPDSRRGERGNCVVDQRHIFNLSMVASAPKFQHAMAQRVLGGWEASAIVTKRTGFWFSPVAGRDNSLTGINADRPDVVGTARLDDPSLTQWFNTAAFTANQPGRFGNAARNLLQGPGGLTFDMALMKRIAAGERHKVELRAEAFNLLNHPVFGNPRNSMADANFGRVLTANEPRILQFALKYSF